MTAKRAARSDEDEQFVLSEAHLGEEIRKLRKARGLSLSQVAGGIGRSISFISKIERADATASIADLKGMAKMFGVPLGWFFANDAAPADERGKVVRASARRRLGAVASGLLEELLSPDIGGAFETFLSTFEPGAEMREFAQRDTEEEGYLVQGVLDLWIGKKKYRLNAGDSFRIVGEQFRWANPGKQPAVVVWVIAPPNY